MISVGIDLGGTNIAVGIVDGDGNILGRSSRPTQAHRPYADVIRDIAETMQEAAENAGVSMDLSLIHI